MHITTVFAILPINAVMELYKNVVSNANDTLNKIS